MVSVGLLYQNQMTRPPLALCNDASLHHLNPLFLHATLGPTLASHHSQIRQDG